MNPAMQKAVQRIDVFTDKYPFLGPIFWILSVQYFVVQIIVIAAWKTPHSWKDNVISDLGNTVCGAYGGQYVCSPQHLFMNAFIVFGTTMALGALLGLGVGNLSIGVLALALSDVRPIFRLYTLTTSVVCLTAFVLFVADIYLGLGRGGMERLV